MVIMYKQVIIQNIYLMQFISNFFRKNGGDSCKDHRQQAQMVCYQPKCHNDRFICKNDKCSNKHQGHRTNRYQQYRQSLNAVQHHFQQRQQISKMLLKYKKGLLDYVQKQIEQMKTNIYSKIDKFCTTKFLQIQKIHKSQGDYVPLIYQYEQNIPDKIYSALSAAIAQKLKNIHKIINKQELNLDKIELVPNTIQKYRGADKQNQMKIKQTIPQLRELKLKFKASGHKFLSKNMHNLNLRGPIVLYVKSHKNFQFGGYSSIMFPKEEQQQNIQNRHVKAFLFSITHKQILPLKQEYRRYAIRGGVNFGFGRGDLLISDQCHKGNISWAEIGRAYKEPTNIKVPLNQWLAGTSFFRVIEYQIYAVQSQRQK